jgi:hypothetical protein
MNESQVYNTLFDVENEYHDASSSDISPWYSK